MTDASAFTGRRILVVEDDMLIAIMIEDMLLDLGCTVAGPANTLSEAMALADRDRGIETAMLDIDLNGVPVFPVADILRARGVPIVYTTGFGEAAIPTEDRGCAVLHKPFRAKTLETALLAALERAV